MSVQNPSECLISRSCPICGGTEARRAFDKGGYRYNQCTRCDMVFINPIPDTTQLEESYNTLGADYFTVPRKLRIDFVRNRYERELRILSRAGAKGKLLDVGCATGSFIIAAQAAGFQDAMGIDIAGPSIEYARQIGLNVKAGDFTSGIFPPVNFDVVTMWATLEHLPFPGQFLAEAHRVLKPAGVLGISVPNHASISSLLLGPRYRYVSVNHLNYFTPQTAREFIQKNGFSVLTAETRSINPFVILQDLQRLRVDLEEQLKESENSIRIKTQPGPARWIYTLLDHLLLRLGRGDLLLIAARKNG